MASAFSVEDVKIAVASEVAQNYINWRLAGMKTASARATLRNYEQILEIASWRLKAGLTKRTPSATRRPPGFRPMRPRKPNTKMRWLAFV